MPATSTHANTNSMIPLDATYIAEMPLRATHTAGGGRHTSQAVRKQLFAASRNSDVYGGTDPKRPSSATAKAAQHKYMSSRASRQKQ
jgi:hypothetical protein